MADKKDKEEKKKQRRIKGDAFWKLKGFEKKVRKYQENMEKWTTEQAEKHELYPDQINWNTGAIFDPQAEVQNSIVVNAKVIGRLPFELLREYKEKTEELKKIDNEMVDFRDKLAKQLNVWPDMIDLSTGVIAENEYEGFDPEEPEEPEEEKPKKKKLNVKKK